MGRLTGSGSAGVASGKIERELEARNLSAGVWVSLARQNPYTGCPMGGRTFRSRWVVRWGMVFGGLCTAVAVVLFLIAFQRSQDRDVVSEEVRERNAKICEEQVANGTGGDDSPCEETLGGSANESAKGFLSAGVLAIVGLTQLIGAARIGVTLTGHGVIVRNPLRTYRLRWSQIKGFRTEVGYRGSMSYAFGRVDLLNGDTHRIEAICAMPWEAKHDFLDLRVIDALNAELEAHRDDDENDIQSEPGTFDAFDDQRPVQRSRPIAPAESARHAAGVDQPAPIDRTASVDLAQVSAEPAVVAPVEQPKPTAREKRRAYVSDFDLSIEGEDDLDVDDGADDAVGARANRAGSG